MTARIVMWHGASHWEGYPEIRAQKKGSVECGPGIYTTTRYETARRYAKGGGSVLRMELAPRLWLEDASIPLPVAIQFMKDHLPKRVHAEYNERFARSAQIETYANRLVRTGEGPALPANNLVNLCVNDDLAHGERGVALAAMLAEQGIDASRHRAMGSEWWVVAFNPRCIQKFEKVAARDVALELYELPSPMEQLTAVIEAMQDTIQPTL